MVARDCTFIFCMGYPPGVCRLSIQTLLSLPTTFLLGFIHSEYFHSLAFLQFLSIQSVLQLLPRSVSFLLRLTLCNPDLLLYTFLNRTTSSLWFVNTDTVHSHLYLLPSVLEVLLHSVSTSTHARECIFPCSTFFPILVGLSFPTTSSLWFIHTEDVTTQHG